MTWSSPVRTLSRRQWVPRELEDTFAFFARPENLPRITPPGLRLRIRTPGPIRMVRGLTIDYTVRVFGLPARWRSLITEYEPPHAFRDVQLVGPYGRWDHWHGFRRQRDGTAIEDVVVYQLPFGQLGRLLDRSVRRQLDAIFDFRQARIARLWSARGEPADAWDPA